MHSKALQKTTMNPGETVLDTNFTCMHCRFYCQYLEPIEDSLHSQDPLSRVHQLIQQTLKDLNSHIAVVGSSSPNTTTKFSVFGGGNYSFIHLYFPFNVCQVKCMNGLCFKKIPRTRVPRGISLGDLPRGKMCGHLQTLLSNQDLLEELYPDYFKTTAPAPGDLTEPQADTVPDPEIINFDDLGVRDFDPGLFAFNVNEGRWECTSYSTHAPKDNRLHPELVKSTQERLKHCAGDVDRNGHYKGPDLVNYSTNCSECGEELTENSEARIRSVTVYTRAVSTFVHAQ